MEGKLFLFSFFRLQGTHAMFFIDSCDKEFETLWIYAFSKHDQRNWYLKGFQQITADPHFGTEGVDESLFPCGLADDITSHSEHRSSERPAQQ